MILPGMGVVSELVAASAASRSSATSSSPSSSLAIAVLGFLVWGHHMFVAGSRSTPAMIFSILSFLVAIPSAIKVFNWTATMYKGSISCETPMLYALGFIGLFTIGGLTGLFLADAGLDVHVHRHVLHRRPLPLHHGRRRRDGLPGRPALLVAEDDRPAVPRVARRSSRAGIDLRRLQPDVLPAVHPRLPRHAAPLSRVPAGVPGAERAVVGRRVDPRRRLPAAARLSDLVAALRRASPAESVGRRRARVDRRRRRRRPTTSRRRPS